MSNGRTPAAFCIIASHGLTVNGIMSMGLRTAPANSKCAGRYVVFTLVVDSSTCTSSLLNNTLLQMLTYSDNLLRSKVSCTKLCAYCRLSMAVTDRRGQDLVMT